MKILLIHNYYRTRGGEDVYVDMLTRLLTNNGHRTHILSRHSLYLEHSFFTKLSAVKNLVLGNTDIQKELQETIRAFKPDIAHIHNIYPLITPSVFDVLRAHKVPVVQTIHNYRLLGPSGNKFINKSNLLKWFGDSYVGSMAMTIDHLKNRDKHLKSVEKFIFPARFVQQIFIEKLGIPEQKTIALPHFAFPVQNNPPKKKNFFVFVGRLSEEKGVRELVGIFNRLRPIQLFIIGSGPLKKKLERDAMDNIKFLGNVSEKIKNKYLQKAIAAIIPSAPLYEFGPLVLFESYANGTPVIAPSAGAFLERIKENKTGFFYAPGSEKDLTKTILEVYKNRSQLKKQQSVAYNEYKKSYTPEIHYQNVLKVYKKLI